MECVTSTILQKQERTKNSKTRRLLNSRCHRRRRHRSDHFRNNYFLPPKVGRFRPQDHLVDTLWIAPGPHGQPPGWVGMPGTATGPQDQLLIDIG